MERRKVERRKDTDRRQPKTRRVSNEEPEEFKRSPTIRRVKKSRRYYDRRQG